MPNTASDHAQTQLVRSHKRTNADKNNVVVRRSPELRVVLNELQRSLLVCSPGGKELEARLRLHHLTQTDTRGVKIKYKELESGLRLMRKYPPCCLGVSMTRWFVWSKRIVHLNNPEQYVIAAEIPG